jgi:hypothetical protein
MNLSQVLVIFTEVYCRTGLKSGTGSVFSTLNNVTRLFSQFVANLKLKRDASLTVNLQIVPDQGYTTGDSLFDPLRKLIVSILPSTFKGNSVSYDKSKKRFNGLVILCCEERGVVKELRIILPTDIKVKNTAPGSPTIGLDELIRNRVSLRKSSVDILGAGVYACVVRGIWNGAEVAIKIFKRPDTYMSDASDEAAQMLQLNWGWSNAEYIVPMLGGNVHSGFLVFQLMTKFKCNSGAFSSRVRQLLGLVKGTIFLNSQGFIHGDLHFGNVLISESDSVMLTDLGKCRRSDKCGAGFVTPQRNTRPDEMNAYWVAVESGTDLVSNCHAFYSTRHRLLINFQKNRRVLTLTIFQSPPS